MRYQPVSTPSLSRACVDLTLRAPSQAGWRTPLARACWPPL